MAKGKLAPETIERIIALRESGKLGARIAQITGIPQASVNYQLLRAGLDPWDPARVRNQQNPGAFSEAEDAQILELSKTMKMAAVARQLGRANTSVRIRLMTLEIRAEKALEAAA